jgi:hypothetical protein
MGVPFLFPPKLLGKTLYYLKNFVLYHTLIRLTLGVREVVGSNPATPTSYFRGLESKVVSFDTVSLILLILASSPQV